LRYLGGRLRLDRTPELLGFEMRDRLTARRDDALDQLRPHRDAVIRDRGRDHRHLQGRDLQPLLPEGEPARIDLELRPLRPEELAVVVESARDPLVLRSLQWGK